MKRKYLRRFSCLLLVLPLLVSFLIPSASAIDLPTSTVDLLALADGYFINFNYDDFSERPIFNVSSSTYYGSISWLLASGNLYKSVYVTLTSVSTPRHVYLCGVEAELTGSGDGWSQWSADVNKMMEQVGVEVVLSSSATSRSVCLSACVGVLDIGYAVENVEYSYKFGYDGSFSDFVSTDLPYKFWRHEVQADPFPDGYSWCWMYVKYLSPVAFADYLTCAVLDTTHTYGSHHDVRNLSFVLLPKDVTDPSEVMPSSYTYLPYEVVTQGSTVASDGSVRWEITNYLVDVSGQDLSKYDVVAFVNFNTYSNYATGTDVVTYELFYQLEFFPASFGSYPSTGNVFARFAAFCRNTFEKISNGVTEIKDFLLGENDAVSDSVSDLDNSVENMQNFENQIMTDLDSNFTPAVNGVYDSVATMGGALAFVGLWLGRISNGVDSYLVVFTFPAFLGIFFYVCSRLPGVTRFDRGGRRKGGGSGDA